MIISMRRRASSHAVVNLDYRALAELRYRLRRFSRIREVAARAAGVEPQQYMMLLQIKGLEGWHDATISVLAERLQIRHHAAVQLVNRLMKQGMVERRRDREDRREVVVGLRPRGQQVLRRLARYSVEELTTEGPELVLSLRRLIAQSTRGVMPVERRLARHSGLGPTTSHR